MNIIPWLAFGLAAAGAIFGWLVAANKAGKTSILENGMQMVAAQWSKLGELEGSHSEMRLVQVEIRAELKSLLSGQHRIEEALKSHVDARKR